MQWTYNTLAFSQGQVKKTLVFGKKSPTRRVFGFYWVLGFLVCFTPAFSYST